MFKFLFFTFILFILLLLLMGFSILRTMKNMLFGGGKRNNNRQQQRRATSQRRNVSSSHQGGYMSANDGYDKEERRGRHRKIFSKEDGEYVDFEEVK